MTNVVLKQILSDLTYSAVDEVKTKKKSDGYIDKLTLRMNKYFNKMSKKKPKLPPKDIKILNKEYEKKVIAIRDYTKDTRNGTEWSFQLLSIVILDYMLNVLKDSDIKKEFGAVSSHKVLFEAEDNNRTMTYSHYNIVRDIL